MVPLKAGIYCARRALAPLANGGPVIISRHGRRLPTTTTSSEPQRNTFGTPALVRISLRKVGRKIGRPKCNPRGVWPAGPRHTQFWISLFLKKDYLFTRATQTRLAEPAAPFRVVHLRPRLSDPGRFDRLRLCSARSSPNPFRLSAHFSASFPTTVLPSSPSNINRFSHTSLTAAGQRGKAARKVRVVCQHAAVVFVVGQWRRKARGCLTGLCVFCSP